MKRFVYNEKTKRFEDTGADWYKKTEVQRQMTPTAQAQPAERTSRFSYDASTGKFVDTGSDWNRRRNKEYEEEETRQRREKYESSPEFMDWEARTEKLAQKNAGRRQRQYESSPEYMDWEARAEKLALKNADRRQRQYVQKYESSPEYMDWEARTEKQALKNKERDQRIVDEKKKKSETLNQVAEYDQSEYAERPNLYRQTQEEPKQEESIGFRLNREKRDSLIKEYEDAILEGSYERAMKAQGKILEAGGIEKLYKEMQEDAAQDNRYRASLQGVDLDSMSFLQRLGETAAKTFAGTELQWAGNQLAGMDALLSNVGGASTTTPKAQEEYFTPEREATKKAAWEYVGALVGQRMGGGTDLESARRALSEAISKDWYLTDEYEGVGSTPDGYTGARTGYAATRVMEQLEDIANRIADGDRSITADNFMDMIQGGNLTKQIAKEFEPEESFRQGYENLQAKGQEYLNRAMLTNPLADLNAEAGDMVINAASSMLSSAQSQLISRVMMAHPLSELSQLETKIIDKLAAAGASGLVLKGGEFIGDRIQDILGMSSFAVGAYGGYTSEARQAILSQGLELGIEEAERMRKYANQKTNIELATEMLFSSIGAIRNASGSSIFPGFSDSFGDWFSSWSGTAKGSSILRTIGEKLGGGVEEGMEEIIGDLLTDWLGTNKLIGNNEKTTLKELFKDGAVGFMSGLMGEVTSPAYNLAARTKLGNQVLNGELGITYEQLYDLASNMKGEGTSVDAAALADAFERIEISGKGATPQNAARLYEAYQNIVESQDRGEAAADKVIEKAETGKHLTKADLNRVLQNDTALDYIMEATGQEIAGETTNDRRQSLKAALEALASDSTGLSEAQAENVQPTTYASPVDDSVMQAAIDMAREQSPLSEMTFRRSGIGLDNNLQAYDRAESSMQRAGNNMVRDAFTVADAAERLGVSSQAQDVMAKMHMPNQETIDYTGEMTRYYNQGKSGNALDIGTVRSISPAQAQAAYNAGRMENIQEEARNARTEEERVPVRTGVQEFDSTSAGGQSQRVEEASGSVELREGTAGFERSRPVSGVYSGPVSARQLGIAGGSSRANLRVVTNSSNKQVQRAQQIVESRGMKFVAFTGGALEVDGTQARGFYDPNTNTIYARADHRLFTADQIARHEVMHDRIQKGEVNLTEAKDDMIQRLGGAEKFEQTMRNYYALYEGTGMSYDAIFEEAICDAAGDMNEFVYSGHWEDASAAVPFYKAAKEVGKSTSSTSEYGNSDGSGWQRFSTDRNYDPETASIHDQLRYYQGHLNSMDTVASITVPTRFTSKDSAAKWAINELKKWGYRVDRQGFGEIYFDEKSINDGADYADTAAEKAALVALPYVLKRGVKIGEHINHDNRGKHTITFGAPVELNGTRGNMGVVVNVRNGKYYTHRILLPDGTQFVFDNQKADREPSRGVVTSDSLAKTTGSASENKIADKSVSVNSNLGRTSIDLTSDALGVDAYKDDTGKVHFAVNGKEVSKITAEHVRDHSAIGVLIKAAVANKFITEAEAEKQYKSGANLMNMIMNTQDPEMTWAFAGATMFSALKKNSDGQYGSTVDFTTVCRKTQEMVTAMSNAMKEAGRGLTKAEVTDLQHRVLESGAEVPCPVCYVFSRWAGIGGMLDDIVALQEKYAKFTRAEIVKRTDELKKEIIKRGLANAKGKVTGDGVTALMKQLESEKADAEAKIEWYESGRKGAVSKEEYDRLKSELPKLKENIGILSEWTWSSQIMTRSDYKPVPTRVLFDLDAGEEFASKYPAVWKYRTTRGPSSGKAILPYSSMRSGDIIAGADPSQATRALFSDIVTSKSNMQGKFTPQQEKVYKKALMRTAAQNLIGGQRYQSTSDFRYEYALDYIQSFWELQALGSKLQTYTKVVEYADIIAAVGGDVNLSVMPLRSGVENGKLIFSNKTGMNIDAALEANRKFDNAQLILVGINDAHILAALDDHSGTGGENIGFVIPYHASGASIESFISELVQNLGEKFVKTNYRDYSAVQEDKVRDDATAEQRARAAIRKKILTGRGSGLNAKRNVLTAEELSLIRGTSKDIIGRSFEDLRSVELKALAGDQAALKEYLSWSAGVLQDLYEKMYNGAEKKTFLSSTQAASVMPHEFWNTDTTRDNAYINGFIFRSYAYSLGLKPRFSWTVGTGENAHGDFSGSDGYWKTLIDRPMYNNDGTYREQQRINVTDFDNAMLTPAYAEKAYPNYKIQEPNRGRAAEVGSEFGRSLRQLGDSGEYNAEAAGRFSRELNEDTLKFLNNQKHKTVYRSMQVIDGKLYPPMATQVNGKLVEPTVLGEWYKSDERPDQIKYIDDRGIGWFELDKATGKKSDNVTAAYNPYWHTSNLMINDQFSSAYRRDNLVTVECEIPDSELSSGYKARFAKDAVGEMDWHKGPVAGKLTHTGTPRRVYLSRWVKVNRIVDDAEVAKTIAGYLKGTKITVPINTVTPSLRQELEKIGVPISKVAGRINEADAKRLNESLTGNADVRFSRDLDADYMAAAERGDIETAQRMVDEAAETAMPNSKIRGKDGKLLKVFHGTNEDFNVFDTSVKGGENGRAEGFGIYTSPDKSVTEHYGKRQIGMYANITRPAYSNRKTMNQMQLKALIKSTCEAEAKKMAEDYGGSVKDALRDTWISNYVNTYETSMEMAYTKAAQDILRMNSSDMDVIQEVMAGMAIRDYADAIAFYNDHLTPVTGFDGFWTEWDNRETGKKVPVILAFNSNQLKEADPVTRDDNGNIIPISERFNTKNDDIRYSRDLSSSELYDANRQLQKDLTELRQLLKTRNAQKEYWKGQTKVTQGRQIRTEDVTKLAKDLLKTNNSAADVDAVTKKLKALGEYILNVSEDQADTFYDDVRMKSYEIAHDILGDAKILQQNGGEHFYKDFRDRLRSYKVYIAPGIRNDINPDGWNAIRQMAKGILTPTADKTKGTTIDVVYHDLQKEFGEWLLPNDIVNEADQLEQIFEVVETYRPIYENLNSYEMADAVEWTANEILTRIIGNEIRETNPTYADRMEKKLADQKLKSQEALRKVRDQRDKRVADLKAHYQEVAENRRERKADSAARTRLLHIVRRLKNKKLTRVQRSLLDQYIKDLDTIAKGLTKQTLADLQAWEAWYKAYEASMGEDFIPDKFIEKKLERLRTKKINDLTQEEVADLTTVLLNIENMIRTENELIESQIRKDVYAAGEQTIEDIRNSNGKTGFLNKYISTETATPEREVHRITGYRDNSPLYVATQELSKGQRDMLDYQRRAEKLFKPWTTDKAFVKSIAGKKAKTITVKGVVNGELTDVEITPAMRMALYLHEKNDDNMTHISKSGVKIPNMELYKQGKVKEAYDKGQKVVFTRSMIKEIASHMSDQERAFANAVHAYYNGMSRESINEISEKLKGYSIAGVENYYPIDTDGTFLKKEFDSIKRDGSIEGMGFLKERVTGATNPIMLYDMNDTLAKSISQHSKYYGLAIPVRNFQKLWSMQTSRYADEKTSVQESLAQNWGKDATNYIAKMMTDLQNGTGLKDDAWGDLLSRARSHYAGAVLNTNASVAMKQAASYPTAAVVIGYAPLIKALKDTSNIDLDKLAEYTPLLWYRMKGFIDPELGEIGKNGRHIPQALNWIQAIDVATTTKLAKAAMYYVNANNKDLARNTDAWWREVANVYNRIIEETQPNYTMMQRPQILRSDNALTRALNMFKTQPFQNFNILYDAFGNLSAKTREYKAVNSEENLKALQDARKTAARAVTSQAISAFIFSLMQFAWDAFRGKLKKYKDKDDEMTLASWLKGMGINVLSSAGGMIPFGSYALELGETMTDAVLKAFGADTIFDQKFYGLSENAAESFNDMGNALINMITKAAQALEGGEITESTIRSVVDSMADVAQFAGIPANNVLKLAQAIARNAFLATDGKYVGGYKALRVTTDPAKYKSDYYDLLKKAWLNDRSAFDEIRQKMINAAGDPFATSSKTAEENIDEKVKSWRKENLDYNELYNAYKNSLASYEETVQQMRGDGFTDEDIKSLMEDWMKDEQGVNSVNDLDMRWMSPEQKSEYDKGLAEISGNNLWQQATDEQQQKVLDKLYDLATGNDSGQKLQEKIAGGKDVGIDQAEYLLYTIALQMADDGNGSYTQKEAEAAINMIPGLTDAEKAYLFQSTSKNWKKNPFEVTRGGTAQTSNGQWYITDTTYRGAGGYGRQRNITGTGKSLYTRGYSVTMNAYNNAPGTQFYLQAYGDTDNRYDIMQDRISERRRMGDDYEGSLTYYRVQDGLSALAEGQKSAPADKTATESLWRSLEMYDGTNDEMLSGALLTLASEARKEHSGESDIDWELLLKRFSDYTKSTKDYGKFYKLNQAMWEAGF